MVTVRLETKEAFNIIGTKTWISNHHQFGVFWDACHKNGDIEEIKRFNKDNKLSQTHSEILGLSCTEKDPSIRDFYFYIGVETDESVNQGKYEVYPVKPYLWAIFMSEGSGFKELMDCEMHAWKEWLPYNGLYEHDFGPELEVYFSHNKIEYWVPVRLINPRIE